MADEIPAPPAEKTEVQAAPPPAPVQAAAAPPPAATVVVNGTRNEGDAPPAEATELEQLREERDENLTPEARRKLEVRIAELEDENLRLKEIPARAAPRKVKREKSIMENVSSIVLGEE
jgi:hypothetical protein